MQRSTADGIVKGVKYKNASDKSEAWDAAFHHKMDLVTLAKGIVS